MSGRNDPCWCGSGEKWKKCHYPVPPPVDTESVFAKKYRKKFGIVLKSREEIEGMREAGRIAAFILNELCLKAVSGVSTEELNTLANDLHKKFNAIPAPLGYGHPPFPKSICTSLNDVICHGIPSESDILKDGDIVNIDVTSIVNGYYGDCSRMVVVGKNTDKEKQLVVDVSHECLKRSIDILRPGVSLNEVGEVIESYAESQGCSVVHQFVGHGIGLDFHEAPQVHHNRNDFNLPLVPGMTFTIEPMINGGAAEAKVDPKDQWTARTIDGSPSAQWEHTLCITKDGCEILTLPPA